MLRTVCALLAAVFLAGCEFYNPATPVEIARATYVSPEPPSVTLLSMINTRSGGSAHAALLINGSQQVLYDPAGTFTHPDLPRADDMHYGMSPKFVQYYKDYHARFEYFVQAQKVMVDRATADRIIAQAQAQGKTLKMHCAIAIAGALQGIPQFQDVRTSYFPQGARLDFARIPGVEDSYTYGNDIGKNREWESAPALVN